MKSEDKIKKAFLLLLQSQSYEKVSISDICDVAKISRQTFYNHYKTKDDILKYIFAEITAPFKHKPLSYFATDDFLADMINIYDQNGEFYLAIYKNRIENLIFSSALNDIKIVGLDLSNSDYSKYYFIGLTTFCADVLHAWLNQGKKESKEEILNILKKIKQCLVNGN